MKKREFLKSLALGAVGLGAGRLALGAVTPEQSRRPPKNWVRIKPGRPGGHQRQAKDCRPKQKVLHWTWSPHRRGCGLAAPPG